jgi:hypothetical protein
MHQSTQRLFETLGTSLVAAGWDKNSLHCTACDGHRQCISNALR